MLGMVFGAVAIVGAPVAADPAGHAAVHFAKSDRSRPVVPATDEADWVTADDYPPEAWEDGLTGITSVELFVRADGSVLSCDVTNTSGYTQLDQAACGALLANARFTPALDRRGRPIASVYTKRVRWQLPDMDVVPAPVPGYRHMEGQILRFHVTRDRQVDSCQLHDLQEPTPADVQARMCADVVAWVSGSDSASHNIPEQGVWIERRDLTYVYRNDPGFGPADGPWIAQPSSVANDASPRQDRTGDRCRPGDDVSGNGVCSQ